MSKTDFLNFLLVNDLEIHQCVDGVRIYQDGISCPLLQGWVISDSDDDREILYQLIQDWDGEFLELKE